MFIPTCARAIATVGCGSPSLPPLSPWRPYTLLLSNNPTATAEDLVALLCHPPLSHPRPRPTRATFADILDGEWEVTDFVKELQVTDNKNLITSGQEYSTADLSEICFAAIRERHMEIAGMLSTQGFMVENSHTGYLVEENKQTPYIARPVIASSQSSSTTGLKPHAQRMLDILNPRTTMINPELMIGNSHFDTAWVDVVETHTHTRDNASMAGGDNACGSFSGRKTPGAERQTSKTISTHMHHPRRNSAASNSTTSDSTLFNLQTPTSIWGATGLTLAPASSSPCSPSYPSQSDLKLSNSNGHGVALLADLNKIMSQEFEELIQEIHTLHITIQTEDTTDTFPNYSSTRTASDIKAPKGHPTYKRQSPLGPN